ncbi:MAG: insulinase family protein [Pirellulales bacterium]|nr:insulinase family protein [Pirellulales bacterium]
MTRLPYASVWTVVLLAMACPARSDEPAQAPAAARYTRVEQLPDAVALAKLSNGLTVIVQENHVAPVATVRCYVGNTGGAFEGRWLGMGLSHLIEHQVSGGATAHRTAEETERLVDAFGGATNAGTSSDVTQYFIDCPARRVMDSIDVVADQMRHCAFDQAAFDREFKVVQRELADGEVNRFRVQWSLLHETIYTVHPARTPTIGYLDVLRRATREDCVDFYRERYVPNNQIFVVVGDVKTPEVLDRVAQAFADSPRSEETYLPMVEEPRQIGPREAVREMDGATYDLALAWPTVQLSNPDLYALDVASSILTEGESSRLVQSLVYEKQLVLSVQSMSNTPHYVNGFFAVLASSRPETWQQAEQAILDAVYRLREDLVRPEELAKAKKQKVAELVFGRQTVQDAADSLGRGYMSAHDPLFDKTYVANIQKVTAEQIRDVARRYFDPQRLNRVLIAPPGGAPKTEQAVAAGGEEPIRAAKLPNGIRVLVKRQSHLPMVNLQAFVLGGSLVDAPETAGRAALVGQMLDKGTARRNARQIADYFDAIGGRMSTGAGRNTLFANMTVLRDDFPEAAAVFAECFTRPTFPEDEFQKVKKLALGAIARRADNPQAEIFELFQDNLPTESPYHVIEGGKTETIQPLSVADLKAYYDTYFVAGNMLVTVFGDVDPDEALALVQKQFGHVRQSKDAPPIDFDRPGAIAKSIVRHKRIGKPTGMVLLGYADASIRQEKDYAALTVLDAILSGYDYPGGWLHDELRGEGLVYMVHAFQMTGPAPGYFTIFAQTGPDKVDEVVARIRKNIDRAREGDIPEDEFRRAVEMIRALHAQKNTTLAEQAAQAAVDELLGLGHDYDKSFDKRIEAVALDDVVRVAQQYLTNSVLVTTSPKPPADAP